MKYILENIFTANNHYIVRYNGDKYMKITYNGFFIDVFNINKDKLSILSPNADLYVLYKLPFKIIRTRKGKIVFSFLPLMNSYIVFTGSDNKLSITANIDNVESHASYVFINEEKKTDYIQLYIQNIKKDDISKLTYIDGAEIYNMGTPHNPYIYIYMPVKFMRKLIDLSDTNKWVIQFRRTILL